jgi:acyl-CoA synthetase (AMP-forming)/AMP-acid ligase II
MPRGDCALPSAAETWSMMTLHQRFLGVVETHGDRFALAIGEDALSFDEFGRLSRRFAGELRALGVAHGDRVALIADHGLLPVAAFWGILMRGAVTVQLNPKMDDDLLRSVLEEVAPAVLLTEEAYAGSARERWLEGLPEVRQRSLALAGPASPEAADDPAVGADDLAAIVYTSGSTGTPKGVCLSHRNLWTVAGAVIEDLRITSADSYLMAVPLHYVHGIMQLLIHHLAGAGIHLARDFAFPQQIVKTLERTAVTGFSGVPFHFNSLIEKSTFLKAALPALRWLTVTGGRLDPARIQTIRAAKPEVDFLVAYGQTECAPRATALAAERIDRKPNSAGAAIRGVRVLILDPEGAKVAQGGIGEVVVAGPNVMRGYWRQPEATAQVLDHEHRLHTGDLGYVDEDGDLFLVGRMSQMIKSAGERIFPQEIEAVLARLPGVREAVVVGIPDPVLGERVEANVRLEPEAAARAVDQAAAKALIETLRRACLERMPLARAPRRFHLWREFPRRDNGKVDELRLAEGVGGEPLHAASGRSRD